MSVFDEAISTMTENPTGSSKAAESQKEWDSENRIRLSAKARGGKGDPMTQAANALFGGQRQGARQGPES